MGHPQHVILSLLHGSHKKYSGILLQNKIIVTHASILAHSLCSAEFGDVYKTKIANELQSFHPIRCHDGYKDLDFLKFSVTFQEKGELCQSESVHLAAILNIETIAMEIRNIFRKMQIANKPTEDTAASSDRLFELLMSSFVVLTFGSQNKQLPQFSKTLRDTRLLSRKLQKLDKIYTVSTPFGMENFFNTLNSGKISNIFGQSQSVFTISTTLSHGAEGCAVFNDYQELSGIVMCTAVYFASDNIDFTLVANILDIVNELIKQFGFTFTLSKVIVPVNFDSLSHSSVLVNTNLSHGSGCLVTIRNKKFVLTCSHVIQSAKHNEDIVCLYAGGKFYPKILYRSKNYGAPYDVALLSAPDYIPLKNFSKCAKYQPYPHLQVFSSGFPIFSTFDDRFNPSIYEGRVTKYTKGVLYTDIPIQAGQSGGPVLDVESQIVGIAVQNIRNNSRIYPKLNMAIPIYDILMVLEEYVRKDDARCLTKLVMTGEIANKWLLQRPQLKHKL